MSDDQFVQVLRAIGDLGLHPDQADAEQRVINRLEHELFALSAAQTTAPSRSRLRLRLPRRRVIAISGFAALTLSAAGVASALLTHDPAKLSAGVACYDNIQRVGVISGMPLDGRLAVADCADVWRHGAFAGDGSAVGKAAPPTLQACVDRSGGKPIQVVPGDSPTICATIGLVSDPAAGADSGSYAKLARSLDDAGATRCLSLAGAQTVAQQALTDTGLGATWTITVASTRLTPQNPCMQFGHDSDGRVITIMPGGTPIDQPTSTTPGS
jgi:hypothetical protein